MNITKNQQELCQTELISRHETVDGICSFSQSNQTKNPIQSVYLQ